MTAPPSEGKMPKLNEANLYPDRYPHPDLFICDVTDAVLKDNMALMEHPFYSLAKKPDREVRRYENGERWVEIYPSIKGLATIYDKDIIIYSTSQMIAKANAGEGLSPRIKIVARDLLAFINRSSTGGKDYEAIVESLDRLKGTVIKTNVETGNISESNSFGLIESYRIKRSTKTNRILEMELVISDWLFRSIASKEVLTLSRDYFRLKKAIERRVYEIARKHCGKKAHWKIGLELLKIKCGSTGPLDKFRYNIRELARGNHLPEYVVDLDDKDFVHFHARKPGEVPESRKSNAKRSQNALNETPQEPC